MNPIYKFIFDDDGTDLAVFPTYGSNNAMSFEKEGGQEFFRRKLSGQLKFTGPDYAYIVAQAFDHEFKMQMQISYDRGQTWTPYWNGKFYKTDCEFNDDDKVVTVTPTTDDDYNAVIAGLEKEFDLISLAPEIVPVKMDKRPMLQFYVPGSSVIGCYLSGMWWEQECEPTTDNTRLSAGKFYLSTQNDKVVVEVTQTGGSPTLPLALFGQSQQGQWADGWSCTAGGYTFYCDPLGGGFYGFRIVDSNDNTLWIGQGGNPVPEGITVHLTPYTGSGVTGDVDVYLRLWQTFTRIVCDVETDNTVPIPDNDIVGNLRNYRYVAFADFPGIVALSSDISETPTEWGLCQPGSYYDKPYSVYPDKLFPLSRELWGKFSTWIDSVVIPAALDETFRAEFTLRHAYPIASVISVLLGQIAPDITHGDSTDYSRFLYAENDPLTGVSHHLFITPKSNLINAGYDQPAQKAPIKLADVLNMLRDCYRCYWFIDEEKRFRIEHIEFFRRGGSYSYLPSVGIDLTAMQNPRNGKPWAFDTTKYKFEKPAMAARYQFGWMDGVTKQFDGSPIDILSGYVDPNKIEQISVGNFTSDVDYILLNPSAISQDGFVLLIGIYNVGKEIETYDLSSYSSINRQLGTDGKWMTNSNKHILIPVVPGQRFKITANSSYGTQLGWFTSDAEPVAGDDAPLVSGTSRFSIARGTTGYINAPAGANFLYIFGGPSSTPTSYLPASVIRVAPAGYYLPYTAIGSSILQNGPLSFAYLQIYYNWDMPAKNYTIDGVAYQATGVKKLKTQSITFPCYNDPDMQKLVTTLIGKGMLEKLSLNLCSRFADATLRYDTE